MKRRLALLLVSLAMALVPAFAILMHPGPAHSRGKDEGNPVAGLTGNRPAYAWGDKLDEALQNALLEGEPGEQFRLVIQLRAKADLQLEKLPSDSLARRYAIVAQLKQTASTSQRRLLDVLAGLQNDGDITSTTPLWIINGVVATGTAGAIQKLASLPEVAEIRLDEGHRYFDPPTTTIKIDTIREATASTGLSWGIQRIRADQVWAGLGIDGQGVTVAVMDSGVDWLHPDLNANYRGNQGGQGVDHSGSWFSPAIPTATAPVDLLGHGTHVAGTAVGQNGIGVAPGAQWIAVAIADQFGFIYDSNVHVGFQWLLAPNGDPGLAPDIINASWGGDPYATTFIDDVAAIHAAGIVTVFSVGNDGPYAASINSPASYTGTLAVGASDDSDLVAWFSSRGPSPLTSDQKPWVVAPGTRIFSALPGGQYGLSNGTSMATPHAAGVIALLKSANPSLDQQQIMGILANSAVPISGSHPNQDAGWGRLDAYGAVWPLVQSGVLHGIVRGDGVPLPNAVITFTLASGEQFSRLTDDQGAFQAHLRPGVYDVAASSFGFARAITNNVIVSANQTTTQDLHLSSLPGGLLVGVVRQAGSGTPLSATLSFANTPISSDTDQSGAYSLTLPSGQYEVVVASQGHRLGRAAVTIASGEKSRQDFYLDPSPEILVVDSGQWSYDSHAAIIEETLADLNYNHELWSIRNPFEDVPTAADLAAYDTVVWSSPYDSPGYIGANNVITGYLDAGGNLLISGQHIGYLDGQGFDVATWWYLDLEADYLGKTAVTQTIKGAAGSIFDGTTVTLNGGTSADNQLAVDSSAPRPDSLTGVSLVYDDGTAAGLQAGHCDPFRIVYLGFGLEGVTLATGRAALLEGSLDYFQEPPLATGAKWNPETIDDYALPGTQLVYTVTLRNLSETVADTYQISLSSDSWPASVVTSTLTLGKCQTGQTVLKIDVPGSAPPDLRHSIRLTATSTNDNSVVAALLLQHKVPGDVLLVDDDRWYDQEAIFQAALDAIGVSYDVWDIGWDEQVRGSPSAAFLNAYDIVIWYTGYDWFAPVTPLENEALTQFLENGGRLFLTSQDFMYYNQGTRLAQEYLGIAEYRESITPTQVFGGDDPWFSSSLQGSLPLSYGKYRNFSDGLIPAQGSRPFFWSDQGLAAGVATAGTTWRSVFWAFPFEKLPSASQAPAMNAAVGWLSDLGDSQIIADRRVTAPGDLRTFTITVSNAATGLAIQASMTNTLPPELMILTGTLSGGAAYDPATRQLTWQGTLAGGVIHQISYQAIPDVGLLDGTQIDVPVTFHSQRQNLSFQRTASIWLNAPDLTPSTFSSSVRSPAPQQLVTYTLNLRNGGLASADMISAVVRLPDDLAPVSSTLAFDSGLGRLSDRHVFWQGSLDPGGSVTVSLVMTREMTIAPRWLPAIAVISDGVTDIIVRDTQPYLQPYELRFPLVFGN